MPDTPMTAPSRRPLEGDAPSVGVEMALRMIDRCETTFVDGLPAVYLKELVAAFRAAEQQRHAAWRLMTPRMRERVQQVLAARSPQSETPTTATGTED